jgi:large subunit ribosomal protein L25
MKSVSLTAYPRTQAKRNGVKKLRHNDRVPAIIYGKHHQPQNLELTAVDFKKVLAHTHSENILIDLNVQGDERAKRTALIQEVQHHALSGKVLHVDFHEVFENEKVTVTVPVETFGEAAGVKAGGILEHLLFRIKVRGLPKDLPEVVRLDVSNLEVGRGIHIGEIALPNGVDAVGDKKITVVMVASAPTEAEEAAETAAAAEAPAEPEMIKEKKAEEGAEAAEGDKAKAADKAPKAEKAEKTEKKK